MTADLSIRDVRFSPAEPGAKNHEHVGYVSCVVGDAIVIDGIGVYRSAAGELSIKFPTRRGRDRRIHRIVRAASEEYRDEIERRLLEALRAQRVIP